MSEAGSSGSGWGPRLFAIAGGLGLVAALWVALAPDMPRGTGVSLDGAAAARVNGAVITMLEYERAAQAVQNDRRNVLGPEEAARILETLINEELLAQEAVRLGLVGSDGEVRAAAVRGVMRLILSGLVSVEPSEVELRDFYDNYPDLFVPPARLWVRHLEIDTALEDEIAEIIAELRDGAGFGELLLRFPDARSRPVPDRMIRGEDMRQYLGSTLTDFALAAGEGTIIGPLEVDGNAQFLWVVEKGYGSRPALEEVHDAAVDEWRRRAEEDAINSYLERLRARSAVEITVGFEEAPGP